MGTAEAKVGELVDGKYELETLLGQGGMGAVYRARHAVTGRRVAIKWLLEDDTERRRRFLREARAMGRLSHPNVVQVFDVSEHEGDIFLVMEYLSGKSLRDFVDDAPLSPAETIALMMPALSGVAAAHQAGVLHRDLKPENLFVVTDKDGTPYDTKVLDFGLAKATEAEADSKLTHSGAIVGTPRYMSPEQLEEKPIDERADVYALGLILYEMLVGELPFRSRSLNALLLEILTSDHAPPDQVNDDVPEALGAIVKRAIERDPDDRMASVAELAEALEPFGDTPWEPPRESLIESEAPPPLTPKADESMSSSIRRSRPDGEREPLAEPSRSRGASPPSSSPRTSDEPRIALRANDFASLPQETVSEVPKAKRHSRDAYAATQTVSQDDVASAAVVDAEPTAPAPARWRTWLPAALLGVALLASGGYLLLASGGSDAREAPSTAGAEPATTEAETPAPDAPAATRVDPDTLAAEAVAPPERERRDEMGPEAEAVEAPEARPRFARRRSARRRSRPTTTTDPTAAETTEEDPSLRVNSRAGVLDADDF